MILSARRMSRSALVLVSALALALSAADAQAEAAQKTSGFERFSGASDVTRPPILAVGFSAAGLPVGSGEAVASLGGRLALVAPEQRVEIGLGAEWAPLASGRLEVGGRVFGRCLGQPAGCYVGLGAGLWLEPEGPRPVAVPSLGLSLPRGENIRAGLGVRVDLAGSRDEADRWLVDVHSAGIFGEIEWGPGRRREASATAAAGPQATVHVVMDALEAENAPCGAGPLGADCVGALEKTDDAARALHRATSKALRQKRRDAKREGR